MIFWQKVDVNKKATEPRVPSGLVEVTLKECVTFSKDLLIVIFSSEYKDFIKGDYSRREAGNTLHEHLGSPLPRFCTAVALINKNSCFSIIWCLTIFL
jgi:hypothetical protein